LSDKVIGESMNHWTLMSLQN